MPAPPSAAPVPAPGRTAVPDWSRPQWAQIPTSAPAAAQQPAEGLVLDAVGAAIIGAGVLMLILALTTLDWLRGYGIFGITVSTDFATLRSAANQAALGGHHGLAIVYFQWLGYALVGVTVVGALLAKLTASKSLALIGTTLLVAIAGVIVTTAAFVDGSKFSIVFTHSGLGFWFAIAGFLVVAFGTIHRRS